jgi:hypothetical protein
MSYHTKDIDKAWSKLGMIIRDGKDKHALFYHNGKIILKTKRSFGRGKLDGNIPYLIRQQMKLSESEFEELVDCPLTLQEYVDILKKKGYID